MWTLGTSTSSSISFRTAMRNSGSVCMGDATIPTTAVLCVTNPAAGAFKVAALAPGTRASSCWARQSDEHLSGSHLIPFTSQDLDNLESGCVEGYQGLLARNEK